jgi:magnesium transporter
MSFELTKEYIETIERAVSEKDNAFLRDTFNDMYPADLSLLLVELEANQARYLIDLADDELTAEIISNLEPDYRVNLLRGLAPEELARYINLLDSDDAADVLKEQPIQVREEVIARLSDRQQARNIISLLPYPEDVAGGLMAKELIKCRVDWTVVQCVEEIRHQSENVEKVYSVYVVDEAGI